MPAPTILPWLGRCSVVVLAGLLVACAGPTTPDAANAPSGSSAGQSSSVQGTTGTSAKPVATGAPNPSPVPSSPGSASAAGKPATSAPFSGGQVEFSYGIASVDPGVLPAWMARDQGFYKNNGLNVGIVATESGARGLQAMAAGQLQLMDIGLSPVIIANSAGTKFRVVDSIGNAFGFIIVGGKDLTPENAAQRLKGGKLGISSFGSETDVAATVFLQRLGLVRDKDVSVLQTGNNATRLAALTSGSIDATPLLAGEALSATRAGLKALWDMAEGSDWLFEADAADQGYSSDHRDSLVRWLKGWAEGNYYARSHPEDAKKVVAREFKYSDSQLVDAAYDRFLKLAPVNLRPSDASVRAELTHYQGVKDVNLKSTNPADYVDVSILDELEKSGFLPDLRRKYSIS
jgi:NitT/TauT family transport system substrate-binding protein